MKNIKTFCTRYSKSLITATLLLVVLTGLAPQTVRAVADNGGNLPPFDEPHSPYKAADDPGPNPNDYKRCDIGSNEAVRVLGTWPSPLGDPTRDLHHPANTTTMSPGQTSKDFQMNILGHNCTRNIGDPDVNNLSGDLNDENTYKSRLHSRGWSITSGPPGASIDGATGVHRTIDWRSHTNPDQFYVKSTPTGSPPNLPFELENVPPTFEGDIDIEVRVKWAVEYNPGTHGPTNGARYACANPEDRVINDLNDVGRCIAQTISFTVEVERASESHVQGIKRAESGVSQSQVDNLRVQIDGGSNGSSRENPFGISTPSGNRQVSVDDGGYRVEYTYCINRTDCHNSTTRRNGNSFSVNAPGDGYVDVRFYFSDTPLFPDPEPEPEPSAELKTDVTSDDQVAAPSDSFSIDAYVKNTGDGESDPVRLRVRAVSGDTGSIRPNRKTKNVGTLEPGDREDRSFSFRVKSGAREGDHVCFKSRAKESGGSWVSGSSRSCVGVVRNFDMRTRVYAPNSPEDELTGPFRVTGVIRNYRNRNQDGMKTRGHDYLQVSLSVTSGRRYVRHLYNGSSDKAGEPTRKQPYKMTWEYSGNYPEFFYPQRTNDRDIVRAWTEVKRGTVNGRKRVCFQVKVKPRYRHKTIFRNYSGWGGIDTGSSYSRTDCTDLWEVRAPYVTTEDGDVHGGSVVVDPETANQQCRNDNARVEGRAGRRGLGSKSTYAVSATGRINNFGSNNSTNDGRLKFGNNPPPAGNYQAICRPDLTKLNYYKKLGYDITRDGRRNIRPIINQINNETGKYRNGDEFVVRLTHPNPRVQGNNVVLERGKRVTFITKNRDFDIRSDVRMEGGSRNNVNDIPSLAIVAGGDIDIHRNVGNIHAYISSNGTVDTCGNVSRIDLRNRAPRCEDWLRIRGALVANKIEFRRTSGDAGHSGPAEVIVYAPEFSLSPPPGTMGLTNNIFFGRPLWERLPFF